jgi:hypothetical protein
MGKRTRSDAAVSQQLQNGLRCAVDICVIQILVAQQLQHVVAP